MAQPLINENQIDLSASGGGSWVLLDDWSTTAVNTKEFTWNESTYQVVRFIGQNIRTDSNGSINGQNQLGAVVGRANGTVWYDMASTYYDGTEATFVDAYSYVEVLGKTTGSGIDTHGPNSNTGTGGNFILDIYGFGSPYTTPVFESRMVYTSTAALVYVREVRRWLPGNHVTQGILTGFSFDSFRFFWEIGNFRTGGNIKLYGIES